MKIKFIVWKEILRLGSTVIKKKKSDFSSAVCTTIIVFAAKFSFISSSNTFIAEINFS